MTVDYMTLARDVDRLFRARREGSIVPGMQEYVENSGRYRVNDLEQTIMEATLADDDRAPNVEAGNVSASYSSRTHVARLALLEPAYFADRIHMLNERERVRVTHVERLITSYVSGLSRRYTRTRRDLIHQGRKLGVDEDDVIRLLTDHVAGRAMTVPPSAFAIPTEADVKRTATFLLRLHETQRAEAADAEVRSAETNAREAVEAEDSHAMAERHRMEVEHAEMVACGDDLWLAGME